MILEKNQKLLFIGDSITDVGRTRPIGEGHGGENLGKGYVSLVNALLHANYPALEIRIVNTGISGNTARHLAERWQTDVLDLKCDWLSIMIGINDVWRQFDKVAQKEVHVSEQEYEQTLDRLVGKTRPMLKGMLLATPYFLELNTGEPMRAMMDRYGRVVEKLARKHDAIFVNTQAAFEPFLKAQHSMSLCADRVHPNLTGHMILAQAFLKALRFEW